MPRAAVSFAIDRDTARSYDNDQRLHVSQTNISKANVCPYEGQEITGWQALGLDPNKIYNLYRAPDELAKAAPTFNNIPLLSRHVPVSADDHQPGLVVGSTGTDAVFQAPYLCNSLVVWAKDSIDAIESDQIKELSAAYRYTADMTPGTSPDSEPYDGVMRNIVGNHLAIVKKGRAGSDVYVADRAFPAFDFSFDASCKTKEPVMSNRLLSRKAAVTHGALLAYLAPKMAMDAKLDITPMLTGLTSKNYKKRTPDIVAAVTKAATPMLAKDADLAGLGAFLQSLDDVAPEEAAPGFEEDAIAPLPPLGVPEDKPAVPDPAAAPVPEAMKPGPMKANPFEKKPEAKDALPIDAAKDFLADKLSPEDLAKVIAIFGAKTEPPPEASPPAEDMEEGAGSKKKDEAMGTIDKPAMDAAIKAAVAAEREFARKAAKDLREAENAVRPFVGELIAQDSAEDVYRTALTMRGIDLKGVHPSAYPAILGLLPKAGAPPLQTTPRVAMDAAASQTYNDLFPNVKRIRFV